MAYNFSQSIAVASTSSGSGSVGSNVTINAQPGQSATGPSNNGGNGGNLVLTSGAGGTSGSATAGTAGFVDIQVGSNSRIQISDVSTTTTINLSNSTQVYTLSQTANSTNGGTAATLTIQAQNETGTTSTGGNLVLTSGTGTSVAGSVNIQTGGTTIVQVTPNKFAILKGFNQDVTAITGNYSVLSTDNLIAVGILTSAITITLPASPSIGDTYKIKDTRGSALANNITISGNGNNIDGATNFVIATNFAFLSLVFTGTYWSIC